MPYHTVHKRGNKFRVVVVHNGTARLARNRFGTPRDGGGHHTKSKAIKQAIILNRKVR